MRAINALLSTIVFGSVPFVFTAPALAGLESDFQSATNSNTLSAEVRHEEGPGLLPADRAYLRVGTNRFAFLVPSGLKLENWSDGRVALVSRDYNCQLTFRIVRPPLPEGTELDADSCSQWLLAEFPKAKIVKQFSAFAESRQGPAYEVGLVGVAGAMRRGQIVYIPCRSGIVEFSLVCSPENFEVARRQLGTVMLTFRSSDSKGELHVSPLSDKI